MNDLPQPVQDAANKLMGALAIHEDYRDTVESALADMWDAGRDNTTKDQAELAVLARLIRDETNAVINGATLTRLVPLHRIRSRADQLLTALDPTSDNGSVQR